MLDNILRQVKKLIPKKLFDVLAPIYHYKLALLGALIYRFPSKHIRVIAVTGTKGKSSTTEMLNSIFETAGQKTALLNTIRFKIGEESIPNKRKMTVPGRFFVQSFLRQAVDAGCSTAILELSSEAAKQFRHKFIDLDALIFTNLSPEHIESHGSLEKYRSAKLSIGRALARSHKKRTVMIANADDKNSEYFLACGASENYTFSLRDAGIHTTDEESISFTFKNITIKSPLLGLFNLYNLLGAATCASLFGISTEDIKKGLEKLEIIKGRVEFVRIDQQLTTNNRRQDFDVVVDYAHTSGSLEALYKTFEGRRKICVLGNTGGGRDKWKRPEMASVADRYCDDVILTNEDPYDEEPRTIMNAVADGARAAEKKDGIDLWIEEDRRLAIRQAFKLAQPGDTVVITGKGSEQWLCVAGGKMLPWDDRNVAEEELKKFAQGQIYDFNCLDKQEHPDHTPQQYQSFRKEAIRITAKLKVKYRGVKLGDILYCMNKKRWYLVDCG